MDENWIDILDKMFLVSPNMLVAQYKFSANTESTLTFQWKVYRSIDMVVFLRTWKSVGICLFADYLSIAARNLDEN